MCYFRLFSADDFVCVEDVGKLTIDHEVLQKRVEQMEKSIAEMEKARQEVSLRFQLQFSSNCAPVKCILMLFFM